LPAINQIGARTVNKPKIAAGGDPPP